MGASGRRRTTGQTQTLEASRRSGERAQGDAIVPTVATLDGDSAAETIEHPPLLTPVLHGAQRAGPSLSVFARRNPAPNGGTGPALASVRALTGQSSPLPFEFRG